MAINTVCRGMLQFRIAVKRYQSTHKNQPKSKIKTLHCESERVSSYTCLSNILLIYLFKENAVGLLFFLKITIKSLARVALLLRLQRHLNVNSNNDPFTKEALTSAKLQKCF